MRRARISDVVLVELPCHRAASAADGELVVVEHGNGVPFVVVRTFFVRASAGSIRGLHAHRACAQFLVSVHGSITVECDDGEEQRRFLLDRPDRGLLVPPSIWAAENYDTDGAVLTVLCDRYYEPSDYIRSYDEFLAWRRRADE